MKKSFIKLVLTLSLATLLISLIRPQAQAASSLSYFYPAAQNNPIQPRGQFYSEQFPEMGTLTLPEWQQAIRNKQFVIAAPEGINVAQAMVGDKLGNYIVYRIKNRLKGDNQKPTPPGKYDKDVFLYNRELNPHGLKEEIKIEIGNHFSDPAKFEQFMEIIKKHYTDPDEVKKIPQKPVPQPRKDELPPEATAMMLGNTVVLGGVAALVLKILLSL